MNLSDKVMDLIMPNSKKKNEIIVDEEQEQKKVSKIISWNQSTVTVYTHFFLLAGNNTQLMFNQAKIS
ncbi:hypothetical protein ACGO3R_10565 [Lactococcus lactis]